MRPRGLRLRRGRWQTVLAVAVATAVSAPWSCAAAEASPGETSPAAAAPVEIPRTTPFSVAELFAAYAPAVVRVRLIGEEIESGDKPIVWYYTGFIISAGGRVLCSLGPSTRIQRVVIEKDGLEYAAQFLGGDLRTRLGLVQLLKIPEKIAVIPIAPPATQPAIGTPIVAISHPFQLEVGPSAGWITGYESDYAQNIFPCTYMRTSIALGPSEPGAPALDMHGNLVGVLNNGLVEFRASYGVSLNAIRRVVQDLEKPPGRVNYGTLPVEFTEGPDALYVARRVVISRIKPNSLAERAGLRPGDVLRHLTLVTDRAVELPHSLTSLGDAPIRRISEVRDMLFHALPGEFMRIEVERDGQAIPFFTLPVEPLEDVATSADASSGEGAASADIGTSEPEPPAAETSRDAPPTAPGVNTPAPLPTQPITPPSTGNNR